MAPKPSQKRRLEINHRFAAAGAFVAVAIAAVACIQLFGDPSAAGPHRRIALNPVAAAAEAARKVDEALQEQIGGMTGGMKIPGMF